MPGTRTRRALAAATSLIALAALTGCTLPTPQASPTGQHTGTHLGTPKTGTARAALATLPVKGRAPMTGYSREQFGTEWDDAVGNSEWSRNGCDTRNDMLARDLQRETVESNDCVVLTGVLAYEPYSGQRNYYFDKTDGEYSTDLDGEHIVALGAAWSTGAQQISADQRAALANDPINLMAVSPSLNRQKGDSDAASWLPPNKAFRCSYVARQVRVKIKYHLWVTAPEKAAMERVLATCSNEPLDQPDPQDGYTSTNVFHAQSTAQPTQSETSTGSDSGTSGGSEAVYYSNCDAVRAAGAAPIHRGDPGYSTSLDRDGDGSACE